MKKQKEKELTERQIELVRCALETEIDEIQVSNDSWTKNKKLLKSVYGKDYIKIIKEDKKGLKELYELDRIFWKAQNNKLNLVLEEKK